MTALAPPLRAAVIGCGTIAYDHFKFLAHSQAAQLVALCDRSPAMAKAAATYLERDLPTYTDAGIMLAEQRPDIVHVLTPPQTHDALVRQCLAAGAHVVCEKPMCGTAEDTAALVHAAAQAGRVLVESRNLLFNDTVAHLAGMVAEGRLGQVRECDILLSLDFLAGPFGDTNLTGPGVALPGGAVHDFLPHLVYLFQALAGVTTADGVSGEYSNRSGNPRAGYDFMDVLVRAGEVRGRLRIATDVEPSAFRIYLRGTEACAEADLYNPYLRFEGAPDTGKRYPFGQMRSGIGMVKAGMANLANKIAQHGVMHGMTRMLEAVYTSISEGREVPIGAEDMLATARLTDQILALRVRA